MSDTAYLDLPDKRLETLGITTEEVVAAIERALIDQSAGRLWTAPKSAVTPGDGRYVMSTLAVGTDPAVTVVKSVSVHPENRSRGLDSINGAILVLDAGNGLLRAVMGANWITAVRTAGLSALVARRLADPASRTVAFLGCGAQARSHLAAFGDLFPLRDVRGFGRGQANLDRLGEAAHSRGLSFRACSSPQEAMADADLVVSSMSLSFDSTPFVSAADMKPGAFASITDIAWPWRPEEMKAFGTVVVDDIAQEKAIGKPMIDPARVTTDLSGLITKPTAIGYRSDKPSAFIFRGLAIGDYALAALALVRAEATT